MIVLAQQDLANAPSAYVPVAIGFFGLATGYFIWGGQALFGFPKSDPGLDRTMGMWGFWMPGFMQFLTGVLTVPCSTPHCTNTDGPDRQVLR